MKTIVRPSLRAFFNLRPKLLLPAPNLFFVAHQGSSRGTLATPAQLPQNAPGLRGMVMDSTFDVDQVRHSRRSPQRGLVAQSLRPALQPPLDLLPVFRTQPGLAS